MEKIRICPLCRKRYNTYPAISRIDNETEICSTCGQKEAMNAWIESKIIEKYKKDYPVGTRIQIIHMMYEDDAIEDGTYGTVELVDDIGTLHCVFDNGRHLGVIIGVDKFRKVDANENE